jgi:hypothetical protein
MVEKWAAYQKWALWKPQYSCIDLCFSTNDDPVWPKIVPQGLSNKICHN